MLVDTGIASLPERTIEVPVPVDVPRKRLTVEDVFRMMEAGVLDGEDRFELWEGQLVAMSPKHIRHEWVKDSLASHLTYTLYRRFYMSVETTVYLDKSTFIEPDFIVRRKGKRSTEVRAPDLLLAKEVTDSSYRTDRKAKPLLYAAHGAPLLWVIDARDGFEPQTHVYSQPTPAGYASVVDRGLDEILELPFAPDVSFSLRSILYEYE